MTDKSPRKAASNKSGESLKENRQAKKDKEQTRKRAGSLTATTQPAIRDTPDR
jgi:hypothetical protein